MISATYFGEITELNSRAVWYSDEEDEDEDDEDTVDIPCREVKPIEAPTHETLRSEIQTIFEGFRLNFTAIYDECIVTLSSGPHFKNFRLNLPPHIQSLGCLGSLGRAFHIDKSKSNVAGVSPDKKNLLWLQFDASNQLLVGHDASYCAEALLDALTTKFNLISSGYLFILAQQFSSSQDLEYLNNFENPSMSLPFTGKPMTPPDLIKNHFESALFEQATLLLRPAMTVCLPDPRNFWFDSSQNWPTIPREVIDQKLNDDNLEKTLIFT